MKDNQQKTKSSAQFWDNILNAYVLIIIMILIASIATYIVPAGQFERYKNEDNKTVIDAESFTVVESTPVGVMDILQAVPLGLQNASQIIFFIIIIAGAFEVLNKTGFTMGFVGSILKVSVGKEKFIFPAIVTILSFFAGTIGMAEEVIVFVPIIMALCKSLGYDELTGVGLAYCGVRAGHINGMMNPFNVGIAQGIAEVELYSGLWYRSIWCVITIAITSYMLYKYGQKVKANPTSSIMYGVNPVEDNEVDFSKIADFTTRHKVIGFILLATFALVVFGVAEYGWYLNELAAIFFAFGIIIGVIAKFSPIMIVNTYIEGAKSILNGGLIVGVAAGILVILEKGNIVDSIVYYASIPLLEMPKLLAVNFMYVFQWLLNLVIPSGSAQAGVTMPIMTPLADVLGINRQIAVLAFHYGDGVTNLLTPACGPLMATLAVAKVPFRKWMRWVLPILGVWTLIGFAAVTVAQLINLT